MLKISEITRESLNKTIEVNALIKSFTVKQTTYGSSYADIEIYDNTGSITVKLWNLTEDMKDCLDDYTEKGIVLRFKIDVTEYRDNLSYATNTSPEATDIDLNTMFPQSKIPLSELCKRYDIIVGQIKDERYLTIIHNIMAKQVTSEHTVSDLFLNHPAGQKVHHEKVHQLLEHTLEVVRIGLNYIRICPYPINQDIFITGTILHDIGKVVEINPYPNVEYTTIGNMLGHIYITAKWVEDAMDSIGTFTEEEKYVLINMILGHHGEFEYGSPVRPRTPEAWLLHLSDMLSSKMNIVLKGIEESKESGEFTEKIWPINVNLYKGQ